MKQILKNRNKPPITILIKPKKKISKNKKIIYINKTNFSNPNHSKKYLYP